MAPKSLFSKVGEGRFRLLAETEISAVAVEEIRLCVVHTRKMLASDLMIRCIDRADHCVRSDPLLTIVGDPGASAHLVPGGTTKLGPPFGAKCCGENFRPGRFPGVPRLLIPPLSSQGPLSALSTPSTPQPEILLRRSCEEKPELARPDR
jgi:hypothetical protein